MKLLPITAISPLDGRYASRLHDLQSIVSEYGLIRARLQVEIFWLRLLSNEKKIKEIATLNEDDNAILEKLLNHFSLYEAERVKEIEQGINHDVKAVEYFIKEQLESYESLSTLREMTHFACTSEDINNVAYALTLKETREQCLIPPLKQLIFEMKKLATKTAKTPMLARTHGQPATPTTIGKEIAIFIKRLERQVQQLSDVKIMAKFNGATGNYNAHLAAYPEIDWPALSQQFIESLDLNFESLSTQIESHDYIAEFSHALIRINTILIDFSRDLWHYISLGYFGLKHKAEEVGSSTMPHKINPIDFENAEGNLGIANALFDHFANKLPISRMQRDLSDSTVLRNLGVAMGHAILSYQSLINGLNKLEPNQTRLEAELKTHWELLAEPIQTVMRRYGVESSYEKLKNLTRGKEITKEALQEFIETLSIPTEAKARLLELTPETYLGYASKLPKEIL